MAEGAPLPLVDLAVPPFPDLLTSGDAAGLGADLAEPTAPAAIVEAALTRFGTIDVLVNAAGWSGLAAESSPPSVA